MMHLNNLLCTFVPFFSLFSSRRYLKDLSTWNLLTFLFSNTISRSFSLFKSDTIWKKKVEIRKMRALVIYRMPFRLFRSAWINIFVKNSFFLVLNIKKKLSSFFNNIFIISSSSVAKAASKQPKMSSLPKIHREALHTDQAPAAVGPYSQAVRVDRTIYISGKRRISALGNLSTKKTGWWTGFFIPEL